LKKTGFLCEEEYNPERSCVVVVIAAARRLSLQPNTPGVGVSGDQ
jgi:hypothetical protein